MTQQAGIYELFVRLQDGHTRAVDWQALADEFGLQLLRERSTQATVVADQLAIDHLRAKHPHIRVTTPKTYRKAIGPQHFAA